MTRLSSPIENIKSHYTVVVIGSGYGGAIAASRLARAGQSVCVLERGKEFQPGEYPNSELHAAHEMQVDGPDGHVGSSTGLYDLRINRDIHVFLGCGLGGTSLVNANVSLRAEPRVFEDPRWPEGLRDDLHTLLEEGYQHAEAMLNPTPYPKHFPKLPKLEALEKSTVTVGGNFYRPPINVTFADGTNHVGIEQHTCKLCGDCVSGCNYGAKNTVLMNYLPDAKQHGAEIYTQVTVRYIERQENRWLVHYQILDAGRERFSAPALFVSAEIVILAAGTLGSTEILLRSKANGLVLSDQLGKSFTGNGDVLAFGYNNDQVINGIGFGHRKPEKMEPVGPCITAIIDLRHQPQLQDGMVIEEGSIPGAVSALLPASFAEAAKLIGKDTDGGLKDFLQESAREVDSLARGAYHGAVRNTQTYLVMAHDDGAGRMYLENDRLRIAWPGVGEQAAFKRINEKLEQATVPLGGTYVRNPAWNALLKYDLITVHPLGGCAMAEDAEQGVVNHKGQVFANSQGTTVHDGLYVCDGAIMPRSLGVNPLLTISALAERNCAILAKDRGWAIDYKLSPPPAPLSRPAPVGLRFTETMRGYFSKDKLSDYQQAAEHGTATGSSFAFTLTVLSNDLDKMLAEPSHNARLVGTVTAPALAAKPLTVSEGTFNLFVVDSSQLKTRRMRYRMILTTEDGKRYFFDGFKLIHDDPGPDIWPDTTTLFVDIYDGDTGEAPLFGKGILKIAVSDFAKQLTTIEVTNAATLTERLKAVAKFGRFFAGALYDTYGGVFAKATAFNPDATPRQKRPLRTDPPELHLFKTDDNVQLSLLRYRGGNKGPVILSHAFGTSSLMYRIDTIEPNLTEYLYTHGYDVWLLDYRASADLPVSSSQFSIDEIALFDYPAAVRTVQVVTGAETVQVMAHCVGAMSFLMAMCAGLTGVRSAICSQLSAHPIVLPEIKLKADLHFPALLQALKVKTLSPREPLGLQLIAAALKSPLSGMIEEVLQVLPALDDEALKLLPSPEQCLSPICRRILFVYGEPYRHDQLNEATHSVIHEMFGVANAAAFRHLSQMIHVRCIVDKNGKDVYLPYFGRLKIPLAFIHGIENRQFLPQTTAQTFELLCETNGKEFYSRHVIPQYGHLDCLVGKNAVADVFPVLLKELEKEN